MDSGRTLAEHMAEEGFFPDAVRAGKCLLPPASVAAYLELHIEQGPVLEAEGVPVGIVVGRWLWVLFARQIYAVPEPTVPVVSVILVAVGALVLGVSDTAGKYLFADAGSLCIYAVAVLILLIKPAGLYGHE